MKNEQEMVLIERIVNDLTEMSKSGNYDFEKIARINKICDENPHIFEIQFGDFGENLGMIAARLGHKWLVSKALDNSVASLQQDWAGKNLGMYAAMEGWEDLVLKALDNPEAIIQQDGVGRTIGMIAIDYKMEKAVLKTLNNPIASLMCDDCGKNIGMYAVDVYMLSVVLEALNNHQLCIQQDDCGKNLGMYIIDRCGEESSWEVAALKALDNPEASIQQDENGWNIGMYAANKKLKKVIREALKNPIAREQREKKGRTIEDIAKLDKQISIFKEYVLKCDERYN